MSYRLWMRRECCVIQRTNMHTTALICTGWRLSAIRYIDIFCVAEVHSCSWSIVLTNFVKEISGYTSSLLGDGGRGGGLGQSTPHDTLACIHCVLYISCDVYEPSAPTTSFRLMQQTLLCRAPPASSWMLFLMKCLIDQV